MESHTLKFISPAEVLADFPYRCRYQFEDPALAGSIRKRGVLQPVMTTSGPARRIVSGHRRLQAARDLGLEAIPVFEIQGEPLPEDLFLIALVSNWNQNWTDLDRAWALRRARENFHLSQSVMDQEILPCLGLPSERHIVEEYVSIAKLETPLLDLISESKLPFRGSQILTRFSAEDQKEFAVSIAAKCRLTTNHLLKTGEWLYDLLKTSGMDLKKYLTVHNLHEILDRPDWDSRLKSEKLFAALRELRLPRLVEQEKRFAVFSKEISAAARSVSLEAPNYFEGEGFVLRARLRRPESVDDVLEIIRRKRPLLNSLFDIML